MQEAMSRSPQGGPRCRGAARLLLPLLLLGGLPVAQAQTDAPSSSLRPARLFAQLGGNTGAVTGTVGAAWDLDWQRATRWGPVSSALELSMGRWRSDGELERSRHRTSEFGITPLLRLRPPGWPQGWSVEAGVGLHLLTPLYQREHKHFSTRYNFGDQLGFVYQGSAGQELSLRLQHYSNAGLKKPNPGENFVQLRYAYRL